MVAHRHGGKPLAAALFIIFALSVSACVEVAPATTPSSDMAMGHVLFADAGENPSTDLATKSTCTPTCSTEGMSMCSANGQLQTCMSTNGCLQWSAPADCGASQLCCDGQCVPADEKNCWACGTACGGTTPVCSGMLQRCACTPQSCALTQHDCDGNLGICVACVAAPVPETRTDFYVDAAAAATPTGSLGCPYQLINDALTPARQSTAVKKTIHLAAGTYNAEIFPISLRGGISLVGAGANQTTIAGDGALDHTAAGGALNTAGLFATIVTGDTSAASEIRDLTVSASSATPTAKHYGIFCDQGSAPTTISNPTPSPFPAATTTLTSVTAGPGYDYGVIATNSSMPSASGCNLKMVSSTLSGNGSGMWIVGCGTGGVSGIVAAQIGDSTSASGNQFVNQPNGYGLVVWDCSSPVSVSNNVFDGETVGLALAQHPRLDAGIPVPGYITVENNTFRNLTGMGIDMGAAVILERLVGNLFTNISGAASGAFALVLENSSGGASNYRPQIKRARSNQFIGNDTAILFRGTVPIAPDPSGFDTDFGTPGDPGNNMFTCNSGLTTSAVVGYDVQVVPASTGGGSLRFSGNQWDHAPPNVTTAATSSNGTDVLRSAAANQPSVAVDSATVSAAACPANRAP